jgi:hypothetical protein
MSRYARMRVVSTVAPWWFILREQIAGLGSVLVVNTRAYFEVLCAGLGATSLLNTPQIG